MSDRVPAKLLACLPFAALLLTAASASGGPAGAGPAGAGPAAAASVPGSIVAATSVPGSIVAATRTISVADASLGTFTRTWLSTPYPPAPKGQCKTNPVCLAERALAVTTYDDLLPTTHYLNPDGSGLEALFAAAINDQQLNFDSTFVTLSWTTPVSDPHEVYVNLCDGGVVPARRCLASGVIASMQDDVAAWRTELTVREAMYVDVDKFEYASEAPCLHDPLDLEYSSQMAQCVQALNGLKEDIKQWPISYAPYFRNLGDEAVALSELAGPAARLATGQKPEKLRTCGAGVGSTPTCGEP